MATDGRANNGGNKNAGRKSKADEEKVNTLMVNALKRLYTKEGGKEPDEEEAKIQFILELTGSSRGQIFVAEHLFGKPKEKLELDGEIVKKIINLGQGEAPK